VLYAGLLLDDRESVVSRLLTFVSRKFKTLTFRLTLFGPGFSIRLSLSCSYDASSAHFSRSHDSQLAEVAASDLRLIHIPPRFGD
jgi:hypothetical protein